ncbi:hypothetical protein [Calidifontibacillus erzurumensis]
MGIKKAVITATVEMVAEIKEHQDGNTEIIEIKKFNSIKNIRTVKPIK